MPNELFISYSHKDSEFVLNLVERLKNCGIDPWIDEEDIPKAVFWDDAMLLGVQRCQSFLFIISPDSIISKPCAKELSEALRLNKKIIPGLLRPLEGNLEFLHPILQRLNWIRFDKNIDKAFGELIDLISSPSGWMGALVDRPSAEIEVHYYDESKLTLPLIYDCYWVGRKPTPPKGTAGGIVIPDRNPRAPITSKLHFELRVVDGNWYALNKSKNGIVLFPPTPKNILIDGTKIFAGHSYLIYREIDYEPPTENLEDDGKDTMGDFSQ